MSLRIKGAYIGDYLLIDYWCECNALKSTCSPIGATPQPPLTGDHLGFRASQKAATGHLEGDGSRMRLRPIELRRNRDPHGTDQANV